MARHLELADGKLQFTDKTHTVDGVTVLPHVGGPRGANTHQGFFASRDGSSCKPHYELPYSRDKG